MTPPRIAKLIVADDLTGACDAGLPFALAGRRVAVGIRTAPEAVADVAAVSTESRDLPAGRAADAVTGAVRSLCARTGAGATLFKKVDSRLRGPVGAELLAALAASGRLYAVLAPSLPRLDRTVHRAVLHAPGMKAVNVVARLHAAGVASVATVASCADPESLAAEIESRGRHATVVVCDARTDDDLETVAAALARLDPPPLAAGSSGVAAALARAASEGETASPPSIRRAERLLFLLGSLEPALRRQLQQLLAERPVAHVPLATGRPSRVPPSPGGSVVLECILDGAPVRDGGGHARALARAGAALARAESFDAIICAGGAVAAAVCDELGVDSLDLVAEVAPGFAQARIAPAAGPRLMALRSGGFGTDRDLVDVYDRLRAAA